MKNKASLVLMEQLIMILVFALAAAVCLRLFAWSDRASREMAQRSRAVILCQNAAEAIKAAGSLEAGAEILGADPGGSAWVKVYEDICLELEPETAPVPGMAAAEVRAVSMQTEGILFSLTVGWQEVAQ